VQKVNAVFPQKYGEPEFLRNQVAFAVLTDLVEVRGGANQKLMGAQLLATLPPPARLKWSEYMGHGYSKTLSSVDGTWQLFTSPAFRAEVLSHFVTHASYVAYETARNRTPNVPGPSSGGLLAGSSFPAPQPPPAVNGDGTPSIVGLDQSIVDDQKKAKAAQVDMTVLGIRLGEPLNLPICTQSGGFAMLGGSSQTCQIPERPAPARSARTDSPEQVDAFSAMLDAATDGFLKMADGPAPPKLPVKTTTVLLAESEKPEWLQFGRLSVKLADGKAVAVEVTPISTLQEEDVATAISEKYGRRATNAGTRTCKNGYGIVTGEFAIRRWSLGPLEVVYDPMAATPICDGRTGAGAGTITFETGAYQRLKGAAHAKSQSGKRKL
jgi:hypothetical protein